jgi:PAS domain S-box-containing protein
MRNIGLLLGNPAAPARAAATVTILLGLASVIGWALGVPGLTSIIPGAVEMKINTAVGMILCGIALLILAEHASARLERLAQTFSSMAALIGIATLAEYFLGRTFGIDELLANGRASLYNVFRGRMSPVTATAFVAVAAALMALPHRRLRGITALGAIGALLIGGVSVLGYSWGASEIITDRWFAPMAANTASCFVLLGAGVLMVPRKGGAGLDVRIAALGGVEIKILAGFIVSLALLLVGGTYTYRANVQFADSVEWVAHTQEVRRSLQRVYGSLAGAEVALRTYLLTTDDVNYNEYRFLVREVQKHLDEVAALVADNPVQRKNVAVVRPIVAGRLGAMASTLTAFGDFGLPAARAVMLVTRQTSATQQVRTQIERMDAEEVRLLGERQASASHVRATTLISLLMTLAVASGLFLALFRAIHREMRARREAEVALRDSDRYTRSILDSSPDCLGVLTLEGHLTQMTPQALRLMEIDDFSTVEGAEWVKIWKGADRTAAKIAMDKARNGIDGRFQGSCLTLKGNLKWWDVIVMPIMGDDGKPARLLAVSRDISDVKHKEDELKETNRFLDSLFEALPLMVFVKDARTLRYVRLNRECERMTGFSREEMLGRTARDLVSATDADFIELKDREVLETGRMVEVHGEAVQTPEFGQRIRHTMKLPIFDGNGAPQYLLGIAVDVTEQKLAEQAIRELNFALEAKATQLQTSNKELESFSYSVSHDLRAPLRAIDGFALMIEEDYADRLNAEGRRYLSVIRENSKRMGALIDDLLEFSRLGRLPVVTHDVNIESLVREVVEELLSGHAATAPQIEIGPLPPTRGDRGLLRQVWTNLIANAIKYSSKAANPLIKVSGDQSPSENLYSVCDNGVGFSMAYVEKLFGVFQRLHRADEFGGTGVGLAIVHRVVTRHGGRVWAQGKVNDGAVFSFALPRGGNDG